MRELPPAASQLVIRQGLRDPARVRGELYIDGRWREGPGGARFRVRDPATGDWLGSVAVETG